MRGKLYGIGVGPGDPELLTIKAANTIQKCGVIAAPKAANRAGTALAIIEAYLDGKELLECRFSMDRDLEKRRADRQTAADEIIRVLECGQDVGFVTLGDPGTYSTYMYVHELVVGRGFDAEIVPGITSYAAAAAALGIPLCVGEEVLTIIPPGCGGDIDRLLAYPGNKVIMKSGEGLGRVLKTLKKCGYGEQTKIVCRVSMEDERLYESIAAYEKSPVPGYFTLAIVKGEK